MEEYTKHYLQWGIGERWSIETFVSGDLTEETTNLATSIWQISKFDRSYVQVNKVKQLIWGLWEIASINLRSEDAGRG